MRDAAAAAPGAVQADLDGDHGLSLALRGLQRFDERRPVPAAFEIKQDHVGRGIVRQEAHAFRDVDVDLVAGRDAIAERQPALARQGEAQASEGAASARKADASGALLGEREGRMEARRHPLREIDDAQAVRAEHPHPRALGQGGDLALRQGARRVDLRETGGEDDGDADAGGGAVLERRKAQFLGNGDDGDIDLLADRLGRRKCRQSLNGIGARIYWINLSVITRTEHELDGKTPSFDGSVDAPTTAMLRGRNKASSIAGAVSLGRSRLTLGGLRQKGNPARAPASRGRPARRLFASRACTQRPLRDGSGFRSSPRITPALSRETAGFQAYKAAPRTAGSPPSRG